MAAQANPKQANFQVTPSNYCPHCRSDQLVALAVGPDLRTITVRCAICGQQSVVTVSE
jgi:transcription elongation factor Elf1